MAEIAVKPDIDFLRRIKLSGGDDVKKCYQYATCSSVCDLSPEDAPFPRKEMLYAGWGWKDKLVTDPDVWLCHQCNDCSVRCPRDVKPGDVMAAVRNYAFEHYAIPQFMGKLVASSGGLLPLMLIPIIILTAIMFATTGGDFAPLFDGTMDHVDFKYFLKHDYADATFVLGNILVFTLLAISLTRFWKGMNASWSGESKVGFIPALISTITTILLHKRFRFCDAAGYRNLAHLFIFFGFAAAFISTLWAAFNMLLLTKVLGLEGFYPPYSLFNPLKIMGNLGGIGIIIGFVMVLMQRSKDPKSSGKTTYSMSVLIWMIGIIAFSGMFAQFFRMWEMPMFAYPTYFIHLTTVFYLLWYAPYSQIGHMFYRTVAMIYATGIDRKAREL